MAGMISGTGNARTSLKIRKNDLYETPAVAVHALLDVEPLPNVIWEPACGPGAIVSVLRNAGHIVWASDLVDYECPQSFARRDFLMETEVPRDCQCIVTNPPFKLAEQFVARSLEMVPKVVMLLRLAFLESERRRPILDSGALARVYVFRKRLPMMHRGDYDGKRSNSGMAFAWFVWERDNSSPTTLHRISWEPYADLI